MKRWLALVDKGPVKALVAAFPIFLSAWIIQANWSELNVTAHWQEYGELFLHSLLLYPFALFSQAYAWFIIVSAIGYDTALYEEIRIYLYTYLMKRLPGSIWYIGGRAALYKLQGADTTIALAGSGVEVMLLTMASLIGSGIAYSVLLLGPWLGFCVGIASTLTLLLLMQQLGVHLWRFLRHHIPSRAHRYFPETAAMFPFTQALVLYLCAYQIGAIITLDIIQTLGGHITYAQALLNWSIAGGAGILISLVVPAGGGARDLSMWALLSSALPVNYALVAVILLRVILLVGDIVWSLAGWAIANHLANSP